MAAATVPRQRRERRAKGIDSGSGETHGREAAIGTALKIWSLSSADPFAAGIVRFLLVAVSVPWG